MSPNHIRRALTRRDVLVRAAHGFGSVALASMLDPIARAADRANPLAAKSPHFPGKAKSVIFLFMVGGPSQVDTFDPKPALEKYNGQPLPASYGTIVSQFTKGDTPLLRSPWTFKKYGQCGREVSTLFPNVAQCVDDLCFVLGKRVAYIDNHVNGSERLFESGAGVGVHTCRAAQRHPLVARSLERIHGVPADPP